MKKMIVNPWSIKEIQDLLAARADGETIGQIAKRLRRSPGSVRGKLAELHIQKGDCHAHADLQ